MSRFPNAFELTARRAFAEQSAARMLVSSPLRYGSCTSPIPIIDRDPGDEDGTMEGVRDGVYFINGVRVTIATHQETP